MNMNCIFKSQKGSTTVIAAVLMTAFLAILSLVADYGLAYLKTAQLQNALDAATLASARYLPVDKDDADRISMIENTVDQYIRKNNIEFNDYNVNFSGLVDNKYTIIEVSAATDVEMNFAKIMNIDNITITRRAAAKASPSARVYDAVPLSVKKENLDYCIATDQLTHIVLKYGGGDDEASHGAFGALDLDGVKKGGANDFEAWLAYGYTKELSIGEDLIPVEPGNMAGPTNAAFLYRYTRCTHFPGLGGCTAEHYEPSCPRVIKVPVVEYVDKHHVKIVGFAAFVLECEDLDSKSDRVVGSFIKVVLPGSPVDETGTLTAPDYGVYNAKLIK